MTGVCGQMAYNNHTGSTIFPFFLLVSKTSHWETSRKTVSKTHLTDRSFPLYGSLNNRRSSILLSS